MRQFKHKIFKLFLRHPLMYYVRYLLLSKNNPGDFSDQMGCFNEINSIDDIPQIYFEVNKRISLVAEWDEFEKALAIGRFLRSTISGGTGLGLSSDKTLEKMLAGLGGVCSDFSQTFTIFCFINDIKVREWGCIDRFYKALFGHSFNEIYSSQQRKWIAIDIHMGIIVTDSDKNYLAVTELFNNLRVGKAIEFKVYSDYISPKTHRIPHIYSPTTIPFLICNYKNSVNDHFHQKFNKFPLFLANAIIILRGKSHHYLFVMDNYKSKILPSQIRNLRLTSFF